MAHKLLELLGIIKPQPCPDVRLQLCPGWQQLDTKQGANHGHAS